MFSYYYIIWSNAPKIWWHTVHTTFVLCIIYANKIKKNTVDFCVITVIRFPNTFSFDIYVWMKEYCRDKKSHDLLNSRKKEKERNRVHDWYDLVQNLGWPESTIIFTKFHVTNYLILSDINYNSCVRLHIFHLKYARQNNNFNKPREYIFIQI